MPVENDNYWLYQQQQRPYAARPPTQSLRGCAHEAQVSYDSANHVFSVACVNVNCNVRMALRVFSAELIRQCSRDLVDLIIDENDPDAIETLYLSLVLRCQEIDEIAEDLHAYRELADDLTRSPTPAD